MTNLIALEQALQGLEAHELKTHNRYCAYRTSKDFGKLDLQKVKKVIWRDASHIVNGRIEYDGTPFAITGSKRLDCQFGKNRKAVKKKVEDEHDYAFGSKVSIQTSKKQDCPATVVIREIIKFPEYKLDNDSSEFARKKYSDEIMLKIRSGASIEVIPLYILLLPLETDHIGHEITDQVAAPPQKIDKRLSSKIKELVGCGIASVPEVKARLRDFVRETLPHVQEDPSNRRFFPSEEVISNHIYTSKAVKSTEDQKHIQDLVTEWKQKRPGDFFYFRMKTEDSMTSSTFLFVCQTQAQKRLMNIYGTTMYMDATYKTSCFDLPLFFLVVKTNVDFQIVGTFLVENERASSIQEALGILKKENSKWSPRNFITDFDEAEIKAVETEFKGIKNFLCNFHREQAWERWAKRKDNQISDPDEVLSLLRKLAHSETEEKISSSIEELKKSPHWSNEKFKRYMERVWLPTKEKWCHAYRVEDIHIRCGTTNGVEAQHKILKTSYLKEKKPSSVSNLVKVLVQDFFPDRYTRYVQQNIKLSGKFRKYNETIPSFLNDRPRGFIKHCLLEIEKASAIPRENITKEGPYFKIKTTRLFLVQLGNDTQFPSCTCRKWTYDHMPCSHMFATLKEADGSISWEGLSPLYWNLPYYNMDFGSISSKDEEHGGIHLEGNTSTAEDDAITEPESDNVPNLQREIREQLKSLNNLSYILDDKTQLIKLRDSLKDVGDDFDHDIRVMPVRKRAGKRPRNRVGAASSKPKRKKKSIDNECLPDISTVEVDGTFDMQFQEDDITPSPKIGPTTRLEAEKVLTNVLSKPPTQQPLVQIGPYTITDTSIHYLNSTLSDEVIDACLHLMMRGNGHHIDVPVMTSIFSSKKQQDLTQYLPNLLMSNCDVLMGAVNEGGHHWVLMIILPNIKKVLYLNPLGEQDIMLQEYSRRWRLFLMERNKRDIEIELGADGWEVMTVPHTKQQDGISCGVYVIKFAEQFTDGKLGEEIPMGSIPHERRKIQIDLLASAIAHENQESGQFESQGQNVLRSPSSRGAAAGHSPSAQEKMTKLQEESTWETCQQEIRNHIEDSICDSIPEPGTVPVFMNNPAVQYFCDIQQTEGKSLKIRKPFVYLNDESFGNFLKLREHIKVEELLIWNYSLRYFLNICGENYKTLPLSQNVVKIQPYQLKLKYDAWYDCKFEELKE